MDITGLCGLECHPIGGPMANGDLSLQERLNRIENKIDTILGDLNSKSLDINSLKVKVAIFGGVFGAATSFITTWLSK